MKRCLFILEVILLVMLCACGCKITQGEIYEKEFLPAETISMPYTMFVNGNPVILFRNQDYPDRYVIKIRALDEDGEGFLYNEYYVDKETFYEVNLGDWFVYSEDTES